MKIREIAVYRVVLPYTRGVYHLSGGRTYTQFDITAVAITTDEGLTGWGESTPFGANFVAAHALGVRAGIEELAPHLIGQDPLAIDRFNDLMDDILIGHPHVKSALDLACWDLLGKATGLPVHLLLGGSNELAMNVISSVPAEDPRDMVAYVEQLRQKGYRSHSIKVGSTVELDIARIEAVMKSRQPGEIDLVDVNCGWTLESALQVSDGLTVGGFCYEQPCATLREIRAFKHRTRLPVMLDESADTLETLLQVIAEDGADAINLKIAKVGGLTKAKRWRDICSAAGLSLSIQDPAGSSISFAAIVHLGQSTPTKILRDVLDVREITDGEIAAGAPEVVNGSVHAGDAPGLGIEPHLDVLGAPVAVYH